MRHVFVDTGYWIATINPRDNLHGKAMTVARQLGPSRLVTSDMILVEVLNAFAEWGEHVRAAATAAVRIIIDDANTEIVPQTHRLFEDAFALYRDRLDQRWSLTDCASFSIMDDRGIAEALTYDLHFAQRGYKALLRDGA